MAFHPLNCHAQCVKCNRYGGGSVTDYRLGLINKIGLELVEKIENDNTPRHHTIEDLQRIKRIYTRRKKSMENIRSQKC